MIEYLLYTYIATAFIGIVLIAYCYLYDYSRTPMDYYIYRIVGILLLIPVVGSLLLLFFIMFVIADSIIDYKENYNDVHPE